MFETYTTGDVDGLSVGSVVKLRGVAVGKVTEIGFSWNMYEVGQPACVVVRGSGRAEDRARAAAGRLLRQRGPEVRRPRAARRRADRGDHRLEHRRRCRPWTRRSIRRSRFPGSRSTCTSRRRRASSGACSPRSTGRSPTSRSSTSAELAGSLNRVLDTADAALKNLNQLDVKGISQNANRAIGDADAAIQEIKGLAEDARDGPAEHEARRGRRRRRPPAGRPRREARRR